jgi:hypothetical protein
MDVEVGAADYIYMHYACTFHFSFLPFSVKQASLSFFPEFLGCFVQFGRQFFPSIVS